MASPVDPAPTTQPPSPELIADLKAAEGCRLEAYLDTEGVWTIGYGHAHVAPGAVWTPAQCEAALRVDIAHAQAELDLRLPWWRGLDAVRRDAMTELMFSMGPGDVHHGLMSFVGTLAAIRRGDYDRAAVGLLTSAWARQVHAARAGRVAHMIQTGTRP